MMNSYIYVSDIGVAYKFVTGDLFPELTDDDCEECEEVIALEGIVVKDLTEAQTLATEFLRAKWYAKE